jgi:hypothetical protein
MRRRVTSRDRATAHATGSQLALSGFHELFYDEVEAALRIVASPFSLRIVASPFSAGQDRLNPGEGVTP